MISECSLHHLYIEPGQRLSLPLENLGRETRQKGAFTLRHWRLYNYFPTLHDSHSGRALCVQELPDLLHLWPTSFPEPNRSTHVCDDP